MARELPRNWAAFRRDWEELSPYERFEAAAASVLTVVVAAVIVIAMTRLVVSVADTLVLKSLDPLDHAVFQQVFGQIMTLLIALEFNHTLQYAIGGNLGIIQARIVLVIALLALARKIIVMELYDVTPAFLAGAAALAVALGAAYWLMGDRRDRAIHPLP